MADRKTADFLRNLRQRVDLIERRLLRAIAAGRVQPGTVHEYGGDTLPKGYLWARGGTVLIADYPRLFAVFGTKYGGNGTTTFGLPDRRGRTAFGVSSDTEFNSLGKLSGSKTHTLTGAQIPNLTAASNGAHTHPPGGLGRFMTTNRVGEFSPRLAPTTVATGTQAAVPAYGAQTAVSSEATTNSAGGHTHVVNSGGGGSHPIIPPAIAMNFIIKT